MPSPQWPPVDGVASALARGAIEELPIFILTQGLFRNYVDKVFFDHLCPFINSFYLMQVDIFELPTHFFLQMQFVNDPLPTWSKQVTVLVVSNTSINLLGYDDVHIIKRTNVALDCGQSFIILSQNSEAFLHIQIKKKFWINT